MSSHECLPPLTAQATGCSTFIPPPFDTTFGLHEFYDFHLEHSSNHPLFIWQGGHLGSQFLTWGEVARGSHRAASFVSKHTQTPVGNRTPPVVALLAFTDTVTTLCLILGVIRAGCQCFCISPRNSVAGVRHLLKSVGVSELIIPSAGPLQVLATAAMAGLKHPIHVIPLPDLRDFFPEDPSNFKPFRSPPFSGIDTPAIVMHSSGSTSFPKPRTFTHRFLIQQSRVPCFGQADICNEILAMHAVPMFHAQGLFSTLLPLSTGLILGVFPPEFPTPLPTPEKLIHGIAAINSTLLITVPSYLEHWAQNQENVKTLSRLKAIFCGGAPLSKSITDIYRESGVEITCYLAATEYGIATPIIPTPLEGSEWFTISLHLSPVFLPHDQPNIFELVFSSSPIYAPAVINTKVDGQHAYATGDLVIPHSSIPNLWKVHGRIDDQIMLSTGEKTNPGPIEAIVSRSPYVKTCVVFGRGRFQSGIVIEPTEPFDPSDIETLSMFRSNVWPAVEEANRVAPSHSRIFKEMIIVSHPSKPFEATLKNTPKRQLVLATYQPEIEAAYAAVAESAQEEISPPLEWNLNQTLVFARKVVSGVLMAEGNSLQDGDDLFSRGADSLQVTWIRNSVLRALRETSFVALSKALPSNFVYEHASITALAHYLVNVVADRTNTRVVAVSNLATKLNQMEGLVVKYAQRSPPRSVPSRNRKMDVTPGEVVVLTGSTGSLGSQILAALVQDTAVVRIYAVNRRGVIPVVQRQAMMWEDHDLDLFLLKSDKIVFVEVDTTEEFEITGEVSEAIRTSATLIIHNAWTVDFNLTLSSFEPNLRALKKLLGLAQHSTRASPPRFIFTSTIGVLRNWRGPGAVPEARMSDMALSIGTGYTESKCIAERVLESHSMALRIVVVRVGQLAGAPNGSWRTTEWMPALVKSGATLGVLPHMKGSVSWVPLHNAASTLLEVARKESSVPGTTFVHLVHPRPVPWDTIFKPISEALGVPLVPYHQWLERLQLSATFGDQGPAVKLLRFFTGFVDDGGDSMGFPALESAQTERKAPKSLGALDSLGREDALKWLGHWRNKGFL